MGYTFRIGEEVKVKEDDNSTSLDVNIVENAECPTFIDSLQTNERLPSYSQWEDFCFAVGLHKVFFNRKTGILQSHPGTFLLTETELREFRKARRLFKANHPDAKLVLLGDDEEAQPTENWILNRLEWLCFWTEWALIYCKKPTFYNS